MGDFDWENMGVIAVSRQDAIAISQLADGDIEIRQEGHFLEGGRDDVIIVARRNLPELIAALSAYLERKA